MLLLGQNQRPHGGQGVGFSLIQEEFRQGHSSGNYLFLDQVDSAFVLINCQMKML